jgi:hypothetical protein
LRRAVMAPSQQLLRRASQVLPDASLNAWVMRDEVACVIGSRAGSHIYDADEREYIDFVFGTHCCARRGTLRPAEPCGRMFCPRPFENSGRTRTGHVQRRRRAGC